MGQDLSLPHLKIEESTKTSVEHLNTILSNISVENVELFLPLKSINGTNVNLVSQNDREEQSSIGKVTSEQKLINQIRNDLSRLTNSSELSELNGEITGRIEQVLDHIRAIDRSVMNEIQSTLDQQNQLQRSYTEKVKDDENAAASIFTQSSVDSNKLTHLETDASLSKQTQLQKLSFFTIQSSISILLILVKSSEKSDQTLVNQILRLTTQLVEQLPMKSISFDVSKSSSGLYKSLKPLINYISELSLQNQVDPYVSKQATYILLTFSIVRNSFKDILPLLIKLAFNTNDIYDIRNLFIELNTINIEQMGKKTKDPIESIVTKENDDHKISEQIEETALNNKPTDVDSSSLMPLKYLQSIGAFPNTQLMKLDEKKFTGQFITSILFAHIDLHNIIQSKSQFSRGSLDGSFSFEFHPDTFKQLFHLIEQLTKEESSSNDYIVYMLTASLRLLTTHLHFLMASNTDNFHAFNIDDHLQNLILKLSLNDQSEEIIKEATKAVMYIFDKQTSSFVDKLSFMHKHIIENKHTILIEHSLIELRKYITLQKWIDVLCIENLNDEKTRALTILHSFIDISLKSSSIQEILLKFQELLLLRLNNQPSDITDQVEPSPGLSELVVQYATHIILYCTSKSIDNNLLESLLIGFYTLTEPKFNFLSIQPIFVEIVPLLAEYFLQMTITKGEKNAHLIPILLGKMLNCLIVGLPQNTLETRYIDTLNSPLFAGGCESKITLNNPRLSKLFKFNFNNEKQEPTSDKEFLLSIYNNIDQGAQLISKMKIFIKDNQQISQQADDVCAAVLAVYIKYYRRIDLAKHILSQPIEKKPHQKLLSIYKYANHVKTFFINTRMQDELYRQIKTNALFLLESIKESHFISTIKGNYSDDEFVSTVQQVEINDTKTKAQISNWTKGKYLIRLLRNTVKACIRLKQLTLQRKQDNESILNQSINTYLYGNCISTPLTSEENSIQSDQLIKCLLRQHERARTRLITYRFLQTFIEKIITMKDDYRTHAILSVCLPYTKNLSSDWHYLQNISSSNFQLKEDIRESYYSIINTVISFTLQSNFESTMKRMLVLNLFHLLNVPYDSMDLCYLHRFQIVETLFKSFIQADSILTTLLEMKLSGYNWFRTFVLQLCEIIEIEEVRNTQFGTRTFHQLLKQQLDLLFHTLILSELKRLTTLIQKVECPNPSLNNASIGWFITQAKDPLSIVDIDLCINQFLMLLLRCILFYDHVRHLCATDDYIEQLLNIYYKSQQQTTRLLALRILRHLLSLVTNNIIEKFLTDILSAIEDSFNLNSTANTSPDMINEFIDIYRALMCQPSPWQRKITKMVIDGIKSSSTFDFQSLESIETKQMNLFQTSLCILGGHVRPYCLGSLVQIKNANQLDSAIIIEIDTSAQQSNRLDALPVCVQSVATNKIEWIVANKLHIANDVVPVNLMILATDEGLQSMIDSVLDRLAHLVQIDTSTTESIMLLQIKRRSMASLCSLLNNKQLIKIFLEKSFASIIAKLSLSSNYDQSTSVTLPIDLARLNKSDLEQYSLSLDAYERTKGIMKDDDQVSRVWNHIKINRDPLILNATSTNTSKYNGWKPYASKSEIESFERGRMGNHQINIVPFPADHRISILDECGKIDKFKGRIDISDSSGEISYPSFILKDLQLNQGKWFYCVRILSDGIISLGWATSGSNPYPKDIIGIARDEYSWAYCGSLGICQTNEKPAFYNYETSWKKEDVCGCGIDIEGKNTVIKYWLNGKPLGIAFPPLSSTDGESDMIPNGSNTTYFPAITVQVYGSPLSRGVCEFIFSPEDMIQCPIPKGYKPLLMPKLINIENSLVAYPYSAYLVGNDHQDYFYTVRRSHSDSMNGKYSFLRDFVNEHHFEVPFAIDTIAQDNHLLKLSEDSNGLSLSIDSDQSMTISFDFELLTNNPDQVDIILIKLENENFPIQFPLNQSNDDFIDQTIPHRTRIAIIFKLNEQTKIYINNECRTFNFVHKTKTKLNLNILPHTNAGIKNVGVWKYDLSEEHIRRLFIYGLSYVANDYQKIKKHRNQIISINFEKDQQYFINELLVPLNQTFEQNIWQKTKKQADHDESIYFKTTDQTVVQLFGNKTYLVLDTSDNLSDEYVLIIDFLLPNFVNNNYSELSLVSFDTESQIYITQDGYLFLAKRERSATPLNFDQYIHLFISVHRNYMKIYANGVLQMNTYIPDELFIAKDGHIDLFRQADLNQNTIAGDQIRIECKSIQFFNKPMDISPSLIESTEYSIPLPFSILSSSLIAIGYDEQLIKFVIEHYNTQNIQFIDTILRQQNKETFKQYLTEQRHHKIKILTSDIDNEKLENINKFLKIDDDEKMITDTIRAETQDDITSENKWFEKSLQDLNIHDSLYQWITDKNPIKRSIIPDSSCNLLNLSKSEQDETITEKSLEYPHRQISQKDYFNLQSDCENRLTTIYARELVLNIFNIWIRDNQSTSLPLQKFGGATSILTLLKSINLHYKYTETSMDQTIDIIRSILKDELTQISKITLQDSTINHTFQTKSPLLYQLQKYLLEQSIQFVIEPSSLQINNNNHQLIDQQANLQFFFGIINLLLKLILDNSMQQHQVEILVPLLFPSLFIETMFDIFILAPSHQLKIFILHLFTTLIRTNDNFNLNKNTEDFLLKLWMKMITNKILIDNLTLKNLRIALMDFSFALFKKDKQILSNLVQFSDNTPNQFVFIGRWTSMEQDVICKFKIILKMKSKSNEETQSVPIEGWIVWTLIQVPPNTDLTARLGRTGREFVEGTFDRNQRQMNFKGLSIDASGRSFLEIDQYRATLSEDGQQFQGISAGNNRLWNTVIQGKAEHIFRRETIEQHLQTYHQNSELQSNYPLMLQIDDILLQI